MQLRVLCSILCSWNGNCLCLFPRLTRGHAGRRAGGRDRGSGKGAATGGSRPPRGPGCCRGWTSCLRRYHHETSDRASFHVSALVCTAGPQIIRKSAISDKRSATGPQSTARPIHQTTDSRRNRSPYADRATPTIGAANLHHDGKRRPTGTGARTSATNFSQPPTATRLSDFRTSNVHTYGGRRPFRAPPVCRPHIHRSRRTGRTRPPPPQSTRTSPHPVCSAAPKGATRCRPCSRVMAAGCGRS